MTREEVRERVEGECARRVKEVRHLAMVVPSMQDASIRYPMMRASLVLFWGHLEIFVKNSSRTYLKFIEEQEIVPLYLSKTWMYRQKFDFAALLRVNRTLGIDEKIFTTKKQFLERTNKQRNKIAHGEDMDAFIQVESDDLKAIANEICEVIEFFRSEILYLTEKTTGNKPI